MFEAFGELAMTVGGKPLTVVRGLREEQRGGGFGTRRDGLDTAYAAGIQYGRVAARTAGKSATSTRRSRTTRCSGSGSTRTSAAASPAPKGHVFKFGYGFARNFRINGTYFLNDTNIDVPTTIGGVPIRIGSTSACSST